jgi:hypothetical protein
MGLPLPPESIVKSSSLARNRRTACCRGTVEDAKAIDSGAHRIAQSRAMTECLGFSTLEGTAGGFARAERTEACA